MNGSDTARQRAEKVLSLDDRPLGKTLNDYADECHRDNMKWWLPLPGDSASEERRLILSALRFSVNNSAGSAHDENGDRAKEIAIVERLMLEQEGKLKRNKGELLMLVVSEIAEAMEGVRKGLMDDKLPHRTMEEVELVDALIRIFDYAGAHGLDIEGAYQEKRAYNAQRADHKPENRAKDGGKKF